MNYFLPSSLQKKNMKKNEDTNVTIRPSSEYIDHLYNNNSNSNNNNCNDIPICIEKIINQILFKSHKKADEEFLQLANRQRWKDGSTSVSCIILNINKFIKILINDKKYNTFIDRIAKPNDTCIFVANTGDSRCILVKNNGEIKEMSYDHKPNSESERHRITQNGGRVVFFGTWRVEGILAVSRSFGDRLLKRWIIPDCDIIKHKININKDLFLILATDGVWDTVSNMDAAKISINEWNNNNLNNNNNINRNNNDIKPTINKDNNNNNNNNNDSNNEAKGNNEDNNDNNDGKDNNDDVKPKKVGKEQFKVVFVALKSKPGTLRVDPKDGIPKIFGYVNNEECVLTEIYVASRERAFGLLATVDYVELKGYQVKDKKKLTEKINP